jgi:hypothetical protein
MHHPRSARLQEALGTNRSASTMRSAASSPRNLSTSQALAAWAGVLAALSLVLAQSSRYPRPTSLVHWLFSYQHGFVRRGLPGEVLRWVVPEPDLRALTLVALGVTAGTIGVLVAFVLWPLRRSLRDSGALLLALFVLTHFATLSSLAWDPGRFDALGLLALLGGLVCVGACARAGRSPALWCLPLVVLALATHEVWLFLGLPALLGAWWWAAPRPWGAHAWSGPVAVVGAALAAVLAVVLLGGGAAGGAEAHLALLPPVAAEEEMLNPLRVLYRSTGASVGLALGWIFSLGSLIDHLILGLALLPTAFLARALLRELASLPGGARDATLFATALSPLLAYPLGLDYARWWSMAVTVAAVLLAWRMREERVREAVLAVFRRCAPAVGASSLISLALGPLGVYYAFPLRLRELGVLLGRWPA